MQLRRAATDRGAGRGRGVGQKSLLQQREGSAEEPRFWMLETIHEYARRSCRRWTGEAESMEREHAYYFMSAGGGSRTTADRRGAGRMAG